MPGPGTTPLVTNTRLSCVIRQNRVGSVGLAATVLGGAAPKTWLIWVAAPAWSTLTTMPLNTSTQTCGLCGLANVAVNVVAVTAVTVSTSVLADVSTMSSVPMVM